MAEIPNPKISAEPPSKNMGSRPPWHKALFQRCLDEDADKSNTTTISQNDVNLIINYLEGGKSDIEKNLKRRKTNNFFLFNMSSENEENTLCTSNRNSKVGTIYIYRYLRGRCF